MRYVSILRNDQATGAGSRGGVIIGETKSGKPIYVNHEHPAHEHFSLQDHKDAQKKHIELFKTANKAVKLGIDKERMKKAALNHKVQSWGHRNEHDQFGTPTRAGAKKERKLGKMKTSTAIN